MYFSQLENKYINYNFLIIGAGSTIKEYKENINKIYEDENTISIGINNMVDYFIPTFHLWTNTVRFKTFGKNIRSESKVLIGQNIKKDIVNKIYPYDYYRVNYIDKKGTQLKYKNGKIQGYFRTAGCLAIYLAYLMGANKIQIVGMDGYTLNKDQHCYGQGMTDGNTWEQCKEKDQIVYNVLKDINKFNINFEILTPTVFEQFYKGFHHD